MAHLALALLGSLEVTRDGHPVVGFESARVRALLAYLVVEADRSHTRSALADLLWPDQPEQVARANLRQALANLRQALGDAQVEPPYLHITRGSVRFNAASDHALDVATFTDLLAACDRHPHRRSDTCLACARRRAQAVALYRGECLAEFVLTDSAPFEEWVLAVRARLQRLAVVAMTCLAEFHERRGAVGEAERYARRLLELDPWREEAHRQVMRLCWRAGRRGAALAQYERCLRLLSDELGVAPDAETTALYRQILDAAGAADHPRGYPHGLPVPPTPFVGRERELATLADLLGDSTCRLITVVGPGGSGKTRLALHTAAEHLDAFAQGCCFVSLAAVDTPASLAPALAAALQLPPATHGEPEARVLAHLRDQELLLVLDNVEQLLPATPFLAEIGRRAPGVTILCTSRERLQLPGEWIVPLAGLDVPTDEDTEDLERWSAAQLFMQGARRAEPNLALTDADRRALAAICRLVGGLPLALELAATWIRALTCDEIAREVARNLDLLATPARDTASRHGSMRAVFDHSWQRLSPEERAVFRRLGVFRGGFDRQAAERVANATLPCLAGLVDKSLVRRAEGGRYELHELLRQYAEEQLAAAGETDQLRQRHLEYFLALAEEAEPALAGPGQLPWLVRLEAEHDNVRVAFGWGLAQADATPALRLAGALWPFWSLRGHWREARRWLDAALNRGAAFPAAVRAKVLIQAGELAESQGEYARARALLGEGLALSRVLDDRRGIASCLTTLALVARHQGDFASARALAEESLVLWREEGESRALAGVLNDLGAIAQHQGDDSAARVLHLESLALHRASGDREGIADSLRNLGVVAEHDRDYVAAHAYLSEALSLFRELGAVVYVASCLDNLGLVALAQGEYATARLLLEECLALRRDVGELPGVAVALRHLGLLARTEGDFAAADRLYRECLALVREMGNLHGVIVTLRSLGKLARERGRFAEARALFSESRALRQEIDAGG